MSRFFSQASFWNTKLPATAKIVADGNYAAKFAAQAQYVQGGSPVAGPYPAGWGTVCQDYSFSVPIWVVPEGTPERQVTWMTNNGKGPPASSTQTNGLQRFFDRVPVPQDVARLQAFGTNGAEGDGHCAIWRPSTDELWEFWVFQTAGVGGPYSCAYGAYLPNVSNHPGVLPNTWGARATGLPLVGGVMLMQEYLEGVFPHMIACSVPDGTAAFVSPANRGDGPAVHNASGSAVNQVPEGTIFRLPPDYVPPSTFSPFLAMLTTAVRDYGLIVVDLTGGTLNLYLEDHHTLGSGYSICPQPAVSGSFWNSSGANALGAANPLNQFPWSQLQQVSYPVSA